MGMGWTVVKLMWPTPVPSVIQQRFVRDARKAFAVRVTWETAARCRLEGEESNVSALQMLWMGAQARAGVAVA